MFCTKCGIELGESEFCPNCGQRQAHGTRWNATRQSKRIDKRLVAFFITLGCIILGSVTCFVLGFFAPTISLSVGDTYEFGGYEWIVLESYHGEALLLSKDIVTLCAYNEAGAATTWETSSLRKWLNDDFYKSFSLSDRWQIKKSSVKSEETPAYVKRGGGYRDSDRNNVSGYEGTKDNVFVLSLNQCREFLGGNNYESNIYIDEYIDDEFNATRIAGIGKSITNSHIKSNLPQDWQSDAIYAKDTGIGWNWLLRNPGETLDQVMYVSSNGSINRSGADVDFGAFGVRPAIRIRLKGANPNTSPTVKQNTPIAPLAVMDTYEFGGYEWLVLDVQDDRALIITKDVIDLQVSVGDVTGRIEDVFWEYSSLRQWLNEDFLDRFTSHEQVSILDTKVVDTDKDNPWYNMDSGRVAFDINEISKGNTTIDKVFLLSMQEALIYFGDGAVFSDPHSFNGDLHDYERVAILNMTPKEINDAVTRVAALYYEEYGHTPEEFTDERLLGDKLRDLYDKIGQPFCWSLRSLFIGVTAYGEFQMYPNDGGIRPAMWVSLNGE